MEEGNEQQSWTLNFCIGQELLLFLLYFCNKIEAPEKLEQ